VDGIPRQEHRLAAVIGGLDTLLKFFACYAHERLWNRMPLGRPKPPREGPLGVTTSQTDIKYLVDHLNFAQKVERSLRLMRGADEQFGEVLVVERPELRAFRNDAPIPDDLYLTDPDRCCDILKVQPTRWAIEEMNVTCWVTGLRCTEGRTRTDFREAVVGRDDEENGTLERLARPSMEASGMDVFRTAREAGFPIRVVTHRRCEQNYYALLLLD